jgi:rhodanese-related sulfurtransferase
MQAAMKLALEANFGSLQTWQDGLMALMALPSSGPVALCFSPDQGRLRNGPVADINNDMVLWQSSPSGTPSEEPQAVLASIDWDTVYQCYQHAVYAATEHLGAEQDAVAPAAAQALLLDVRRAGMFEQATTLIPGARWHDPVAVGQWAQNLPRDQDLLVYCIYGHEVGRVTALRLQAAGLRARYLRGGIDAWQSAGKALAPKPASTRWVTRDRPKIDRIACPWLILRFIDPQAEFLYVPAADVLQVAQQTGATPYDIPGVEMTHVGDLCSFDAFIHKYKLHAPALQQLATIVRGADTSRLDLSPQSAGLYAISLGLSRNFDNDHEMLQHGLVMYDALYAWCQQGQRETHTWPPKMA